MTATAGKTRLPFWTWIVPLPVFHLGTYISHFFQIEKGLSMFYLPAATVIVLLNWWGFWRVFPAFCINAFFGVYVWVDYWVGFEWWALQASIPEMAAAFTSWLLYTHWARGKYWIPSVREFVLFMGLAVMIPVVSRFVVYEFLYRLGGAPSSRDFTWFLFNWQSDFTFIFVITLPLLHLVTPFLAQHKLLARPCCDRACPVHPITVPVLVENGFIYLLLLAFSLYVPFSKFWYLFGSVSFYIALRFGFKATLLINVYIVAITYVIPSLYSSMPRQIVNYGGELYYIFLGSFLLCIFASLTGRTISDLRSTEDELHQKNEELEHTNKELDHFVYSISHDISAPLKTMQGLIHLSRIDRTYNYMDKFEHCVRKLDDFLLDILKVTENKKQEIRWETVRLKELCQEIVDDLRNLEASRDVQIRMENLEREITADKTRLKIVLNNIIANSMKYKKQDAGEQPYVKISCVHEAAAVKIKVEDNGEGIAPKVQAQIFNMFYRGNEKSKGPGLGLYIAHQTVSKIGGQISVESIYGKGSVFTVNLPVLG